VYGDKNFGIDGISYKVKRGASLGYQTRLKEAPIIGVIYAENGV